MLLVCTVRYQHRPIISIPVLYINKTIDAFDDVLHRPTIICKYPIGRTIGTTTVFRIRST
jgi:hypothetical protein